MFLRDVPEKEFGKVVLVVKHPLWEGKTFTPRYKHNGLIYGHDQDGIPSRMSPEAIDLWERIPEQLSESTKE